MSEKWTGMGPGVAGRPGRDRHPAVQRRPFRSGGGGIDFGFEFITKRKNVEEMEKTCNYSLAKEEFTQNEISIPWR